MANEGSIPEQQQAERVDEDWSKALRKGRYLLQLLRLSDHDAGQLQNPRQDSVQSSFTSPEDLIAAGYLPKDKPFDSQTLQEPLRAIGATDEEICGGIGATTTTYSYEWHTSEYGIMSPYFTVAALSDSGILIAISNYSPKAVADLEDIPLDDLPSDFPTMVHWSDVAFLHWKEASLPSLNRTVPTELKYVIRSGIQNDQTIDIVNLTLARNHIELLPEWPGITFDMDTEEAQALLGTRNGSGVAFLLTQHKRELGHKTVEKVTMFYENDPNDLCRWPSLLFYLKDVSSTL